MDRSGGHPLGPSVTSLHQQVPFLGRNAHDIAGIYRKKIDGDLAPPRQLVPELSARVSDAILQALDVDSKKRQASVGKFLASLTAESVTVPSAADPGPARAVPEVVVPELSPVAGGGHFTRDIAFSSEVATASDR